VIEADAIVHRLYQRGSEGYGKLVDALGETILDSSKDLDRGLLAATMMRDSSVYATVNHLIHPLVHQTWKSEVSKSLRLHPRRSVAVIIPLLFEVGVEESFDGKVMVGCRESVSRRRLMERGLTPEAVDFWMGKQWAVEKKAQACDQVLWNEGSLALLRDQVERLADPEGEGRQPADRRSEKAKL
jgi:dephospho-CoA kinase